MRLLVGFIFGLMVASAFSEEIKIPNLYMPQSTDGLIGRVAFVRVDQNGYVICSTEQPKAEEKAK